MQAMAKPVEQGVPALSEPETPLVSESNRHRRCPEMDLVAAVLEDALRCIARYAGTKSPRRQREFLEACRWIWRDSCDWPFAFNNVCDLLGLNASAVRQHVQRVISATSGGDASAGMTSKKEPR